MTNFTNDGILLYFNRADEQNQSNQLYNGSSLIVTTTQKIFLQPVTKWENKIVWSDLAKNLMGDTDLNTGRTPGDELRELAFSDALQRLVDLKQ